MFLHCLNKKLGTQEKPALPVQTSLMEAEQHKLIKLKLSNLSLSNKQTKNPKPEKSVKQSWNVKKLYFCLAEK